MDPFTLPDMATMPVPKRTLNALSMMKKLNMESLNVVIY